ncbi:related to PalC protein [Rhynchosporium secalis]|uniref:pH-response regulator protein palC n=1 Tax=Rhynchosporium secalis TaxID=38038 RepID=A0A1E1LVK1_RHYSE|nr:related to PalC protein [Rhynchosporium secalis]
MPYPLILPTTSSFSFSTYFESSSHPSLPLTASTYRGVLRDTLKKHKRLSPSEQTPHLSSVLLALNNYIPYLLAIDNGLGSHIVAGEEVDVVLKTTPSLEWRPTLSENLVPGQETARIKIKSLEYEIYFVLQTLGYAYTLLSRSSLRLLYSSAIASPSAEQRTLAITTATKHLLAAASVHDYIPHRSDQISSTPPCVDISQSTASALKSLALAEATLLAVLKDDPYPAIVAQNRNQNDRDWMIMAPEIPKLRVHLFARLCLAASEHAANASSLLQSSLTRGRSKIDTNLVKYVEDLRCTGRGKACRFFGIDAEMVGKTGDAIAWLTAGMNELGLASKDEGKKGLSFGRMKKGWDEKREDKRVEKEALWGSDAGRAEEGRVVESLQKKWNKMNDTINTQVIPPPGPLVASMPSGREIYTLTPWNPPALDSSILENMRAPPDRADDYGSDASSDDENQQQNPVGAFPGTKSDYAGSSNYY